MDTSVYISRKNDNKVARIDLYDVDEDDDVWTALAKAMPLTEARLREDELLGADLDEYEARTEELFDGDRDDAECAGWLDECEARAVELDELGRVTGAVAGFEGAREWAIRKAVEAAQTFIENSGVDTSELRVEVRIGDETVWAFDDSEGSE